MTRCLIAFNPFSCELIIPAHSTCVKWSWLGERGDKWCALCVSSLKGKKMWKWAEASIHQSLRCAKSFFSFFSFFFFFFVLASDVICLENLWSQSEGTQSRGRAEHWRITDGTPFGWDDKISDARHQRSSEEHWCSAIPAAILLHVPHKFPWSCLSLSLSLSLPLSLSLSSLLLHYRDKGTTTSRADWRATH